MYHLWLYKHYVWVQCKSCFCCKPEGHEQIKTYCISQLLNYWKCRIGVKQNKCMLRSGQAITERSVWRKKQRANVLNSAPQFSRVWTTKVFCTSVDFGTGLCQNNTVYAKKAKENPTETVTITTKNSHHCSSYPFYFSNIYPHKCCTSTPSCWKTETDVIN